MSVRDDLLNLSADKLASLANKGLVKRAVKEIDAGKVPTIETLEDETVVGRFEGDIETKIPVDSPLKDWPCTCGARGKCRHRVALVLAYQREHALSSGGRPSAPPPEPKFEPWSPAIFDDDALTALAGKRAMSRARTMRRKGYVAKVRRATPESPDRKSVV